MKFNKLVIAIALATAAVGANATDLSTGLTFDSLSKSYVGSLSETSGVFDGGSDIFTFTLPGSVAAGLYTVTANLVSYGGTIDWALTNLNGTKGISSLSVPGLISFGAINTSASTPYILTIYGSGASSLAATLAVSAPLAPVPEPESYAMLLAGLGLMGTIARRRSKSKAV